MIVMKSKYDLDWEVGDVGDGDSDEQKLSSTHSLDADMVY